MTEEIKRLRRVCFTGHRPEKLNRSEKNVIEAADLVRFICPNYSKSCFQIRNEWMVDHSSRVIAVFNGQLGGTKNTIDYAKIRAVEICYA